MKLIIFKIDTYTNLHMLYCMSHTMFWRIDPGLHT